MAIRFKHLSETERLVAEEFLKRVIVGGKVECDVPLKVPLKIPKEPRYEAWIKMWEYLTAKKIDMVIETEDAIHIVEIKEKLSASAVGQLKLYKMLYEEQYKPRKPIVLWHIAVWPDDAVIRLLEKEKIRWWCLHAFA